MKTKLITLLLLTLTVFWQAKAQTHWCGFEDVLHEQQQKPQAFNDLRQQVAQQLRKFRQDQGLQNQPPCNGCISDRAGCFKTTYVIPVVIHVVHLSGDNTLGTGSNISQAQIDNAIDVLNSCFRNESNTASPATNTGIQFCLARVDPNGDPFSGVVRYSNSALSNFKKNQLKTLFGLGQYYDAQKYINIYVVNQILDTAGVNQGVLGTSTYPYNALKGVEGIVIDHKFFGNYNQIGSPLNSASLGYTLSHEMGHYLGLYHPFDFGCAGTTDNNCDIDGDMCCDVPAVSGINASCSNPINSCVGENYSGVDPDDQKQNYMDYSSETCKSTFTADQSTLMHFVLNKYRKGLIDPATTNSLNLNCCFLSPQWTGDEFLCHNGDSALYTALNLGTGKTYVWRIYKGNTLVRTITRTTYITNFVGLDTGIYNISLTVRYQGDSVSLMKRNYLKIVNCVNKIADNKSNWFFGEYAGLQFFQNGTYPDKNYFDQNRQFKNQTDPGEGTLSISDGSGNLLFYGGTGSVVDVSEDSFKIYDRLYRRMKGATPLAWANATQPAICMPLPDSANKYFVVTNTRKDYLSLSVIDLNKNTVTRGEVTSANRHINLPTALQGGGATFNEPLAAIEHCEENNYWLVSSIVRSPDYYLVVYKIDHTGATYHTHYAQSGNIIQTSMKFSPDGRWFAVNNDVYLFDRKNGTLTLAHSFTKDSTEVFSLTFSPDSRILYTHERTRLGSFDLYERIYQYDLTSSDPFTSRQRIQDFYTVTSFQIGPDNKVYVANFDNPNFVETIDKPNKLVSGADNACGYTPSSIKLNGGKTVSGLPQFVNAAPPEDVFPNFLVQVSECKTARFIVNQCCLANQVQWKFGDGATGTGLDTLHTYGAGDSFRVVMKFGIDSVVRYIKFKVNPNDKKIIGDTSVCDTAFYYKYFTSKYSGSLKYNWSATGNINSNLNNSEVKWTSNGTVKLVVFDTRTGCKDSSQMSVVIGQTIAGNRIDTSQIACDTAHLSNMTGSTPTGGTGTYTYQWYYKADGQNWKPISGGTTKNLMPFKSDSVFYYMRRVTSGSCASYSNIISKSTLINFKDIKVIHLYCESGLYPIRYSKNTSVTYQWQKSTDKTNWTNVGVANDSFVNVKRKKVSLTNDTVYYRRKLIYNGCELYSNTVIINPDVFIEPYKLKTFKTCSTYPVYMSIGVNTNRFAYLKYKWYKSPVGFSNLVYLGTSSKPEIYVSASSVSHNDNIYCHIVDEYCGDSVESGYYLINKGSLSAFTAGYTQWVDPYTSFTPNSGFLSYPGITNFLWWEKSTDNGVTWSKWLPVLPGFYTIPLVTPSDDGTIFRGVAHNNCPKDTAYYEKGSRIYLRVNNPNGQYWIKDSRRDIGNEPNWIDKDNYTHSFDLWAREPWDSGRRVWNWWEQSSVRCDTHNLIHAMVRNYGNSPLQAGKLRLYWTVNSLNEDWRVAWDGSQKFYNNTKKKWYPKGGRINNTPVELNNYAAQLQNHNDSVLVTYRWNEFIDTIPKPEWYYMLVNGDTVRSNYLGMCLLARITTDDNWPYGMGTIEDVNTSTTTHTGNLRNNVIYNRKIASNNYYLAYMKPPYHDENPWITFMSVSQRPDTPVTAREVKIRLDVSNDHFFNSGEVLLTMDDQLWPYFQGAGYPGTGFTVLGPNQIVINSANAEIGNFECPVDLEGMISLNFRYKPGYGSTPDMAYYLFTLSEWLDDTVRTGAMHYGLEAPTDHEPGGGGEGKPIQLKTSNPENPNTKFSVRPNPFNQYLDVEYQTLPMAKVKIQLFDATGKLVKDICDCKADAKGSIKVRTTTANLTAGTYIVKLWENGVLLHEKVIKNN